MTNFNRNIIMYLEFSRNNLSEGGFYEFGSRCKETDMA